MLMDIVINASPLILLSKIDHLSLLNKLFDTVYIPYAVLNEIQAIDIAKMKMDFSVVSFAPLEVSNKTAVHGLLVLHRNI
jgi:predicted nucleic acid-binding protein